MKNPNAAVAGGGSGLSVLVVWLAGNVFHWSLSAEDGALLAGAVATVVLFIGREGIKGVWRKLWSGQDGATLIEVLIVLMVVAIVLLFIKVY